MRRSERLSAAARQAQSELAQNELAQRLHVVLVLSAVVGIVTGVLVAGFDHVARDVMLAAVLDLPIWWAAAIPMAGLLVSVVVLRYFADGDGATTDAYVRSYHERGGQLLMRRLPARIIATAATLGSGGALGYEGPAILIGGSIGSFAERRFTSRFTQDDAKVLMVAGAAAGIAAVFKAPLTGLVFALEVPYTQDVARRALLPALVASGTAYLTFVSFLGTTPVLAVGGFAPFDIRDLLGGAALGVMCGVLARTGAWGITRAKSLPLPARLRVPIAGAVLFGLAVLTNHFYDAPLSLGSGYDAIRWGQGHESALALLVGLFVLRFAATWFTVAGGGVGGLFIPLVTQGAIAGQIAQALVHGQNPGLLPTVGIAAFLGGGYRTPLAGVAFVAEATGQPGFVVPALLAAAASQLVMGRWSFSPYQRTERRPAIVPLDQLHVREIMSPNPDTVQASMPVDECVKRMMAGQRRWVPVLDGQRYVGLLALSDVAVRPEGDWPGLRCLDIAREDAVVASVEDSVASVSATIRSSGIDALAVIDAGIVVGVITIRDIANVERLLDRLSPDETDPH
jgi:CIC family chloride channel protein